MSNLSETKIRKLIAVVSALIIVASVFSACGGTSGTNQSTNSTAASSAAPSTAAPAPSTAPPADDGSAFTYDKTGESYAMGENGYPQLNGTSLSIWMPMIASYAEGIDTFADMQIIKNWMEMLDVDLKFQHPANGQERENFTLMIASNALPDLIFQSGSDNAFDGSYAGGVAGAYADGLLYDYTELINEQNTPKFIDKVLGDDYMLKGARDDSGRIVRLGSTIYGSEESCTTMFGFMMRGDMLKATGRDVPVTIDDWYETLKAMKQNGVEYPLVLDKNNYWRTRNAFSAAYGISADNYYVREDGSIGYGPYEDAYHDYLTTMNKWYAEGLINPDFMNQDIQHTFSMIADDLGAATPNHLYNYNIYYYTTVESEHPEKAMVAVDMPVLNKGDKIRLMVTNRGLSVHKYITADTKYPLACVLLLESLYDDDVTFMMINGIENVGYKYNDLGYPVNIPIATNMSSETTRQLYIHQLASALDNDLDFIVTSKYGFGVQPDCVKLMVKHGYDGIFPTNMVTFTTEESKTIADYQVDINTYRDEMMLKFITGNESLSNFAAYQDQLKQMNMEDLLETYQTAYNRYLTR